LDSRPIRGLKFARLADLPALGFGAWFTQLTENELPGADAYIRPESATGL
jgi:hypothetical protein